ncbi:hypothetical protein C1645_811717 [Glomus cerebriforme]|uniref:Uncharacterized protein n=1 Tax=Glomus cerebriforme TaxID=658196 RepID=A0A397TP75_9GLOM|nr:hypothetical protein C1645_811717 [Glomus cerebriforme]
MSLEIIVDAAVPSFFFLFLLLVVEEKGHLEEKKGAIYCEVQLTILQILRVFHTRAKEDHFKKF